MLDLIKIGSFISNVRKEQGLTQNSWQNVLVLVTKQFPDGRQAKAYLTLASCQIFAKHLE